MHGIIKEFENIKTSKELPTRIRVFPLRTDDQFIMNAYGVKQHFGIDIKDINLCEQRQFWPNIICIKKIKRKWWQIWRPRYVAATFRVMG